MASLEYALEPSSREHRAPLLHIAQQRFEIPLSSAVGRYDLIMLAVFVFVLGGALWFMVRRGRAVPP